MRTFLCPTFLRRPFGQPAQRHSVVSLNVRSVSASGVVLEDGKGKLTMACLIRRGPRCHEVQGQFVIFLALSVQALSCRRTYLTCTYRTVCDVLSLSLCQPSCCCFLGCIILRLSRTVQWKGQHMMVTEMSSLIDNVVAPLVCGLSSAARVCGDARGHDD